MKRGLLFLILLLFSGLPALAAREAQEDYNLAAMNMRGGLVSEVLFEGDALGEAARAKFSALKGKDFNPMAVRNILLWYHENGGDAFVEVKVSGSRGAAVLHVRSRQKLRIQEITFTGNSAFPSNILSPAIDLKDGFEFEREAAEAAVQKLSSFYSKQGYLATDIKYSFDNASRVLKFTIFEGEPTLLESFDISPLTTIELAPLRKRYERDIREKFGLERGDRIQRDKVLDGIQAVKDWLREHDFLMARDPTLEYRVSAEGRVGLFLNINYGPRIRYGFRGNTQFSYRELINFVSEVKEVASGSDYLIAVRRRVLDAYKEIGFANAQITTLVKEDPSRGIRYVSLIVNEGGKIRIDDLVIDGVYSMPADEAKSKFQAFGSRLVQRGYYHEAGINRAADLFAEHLKSLGFLSAKLEYVKFDFNEKRDRVVVSLLFSEGVQTKVQNVKFVGIKSLQEAEVMEMLGLKVGQPFDIYAFEKGLITLKEKYQALGNLSAQITNEAADTIVRYSKDHAQVSIEVDVDEGPIYQVGDIIVRRNQSTHARVILRELPFTTGDVLTAPLLTEAEENLRKLNLFTTVALRPVDRPGSDNVKDILIIVEESTPGSFDVVPGFRNDLGLRLGFELGYQNIGGWNRGIFASAVFNRRLDQYKFPEYKFSVGFREPYLANWPVTFTTNLDVLKRQFSNFDASVSRVAVGVKRDLTRILSGFLEYTYELNNIRHLRGLYASYGDSGKDFRKDFIGTLTPGLIIDSRNDRFNPSQGIYSVNRFEVASRLFGSKHDVAFYRTTSYNSSYFRVFDDIVFAGAVNLGWERSNAVVENADGTTKASPIPAYKLFRLGGIGSIRGYREDGIEVETDKDIGGVLGMVNYRGEFRIPLMGNLGTAVFIDAGNLMVDRFAFRPEKLRSSAGAGLRYGTAVGPVVLDFAWRLQGSDLVGDTRLTTDGASQAVDRFKIHFSIGAF